MKKRFLFSFFFTVVVALVLSSGFYYLICRGIKSTMQDNKLNYLVVDTSYYNTVFFGASSIYCGVGPVWFDSIAGTNSYNAGMSSLLISQINLLVKKFIESHKAPRNIFI